MFWLGLAAGVLIPLGLVPLCATVLLRRWLANEGFEDPDDDDDDEFDWRAPSDHRGGQHATPAPVPELQPGEIVALADDVGEVSDRLYVVAACKGAITAVDPVDGGRRQFAKTRNVRRLGDQRQIQTIQETPIEKAIRLSTPERPVGAIVPGPRLTDDPSRIDDAWIAEQRARLAAKQVEREQAEWDAVFGADRPRRTDVELDALADTIRRNA